MIYLPCTNFLVPQIPEIPQAYRREGPKGLEARAVEDYAEDSDKN
jgi:hypothetical protein